MEKANPKRRKPIHEEISVNEISDNVKNYAVIKLNSRTKKINNDESDDEHNICKTNSCGFRDIQNTSNDSKEESTEDEEYENIQKSYNQNVTSSRSTRNYRIKDSRVENNVSRTGSDDYVKTEKNINKKPSSKNINNYKSIIIFFIIIFLAIAIYWQKTLSIEIPFSKNVEENSIELKKNIIKKSLKDILRKYKNQEKDLWRNAYVGISNIISNPQIPSIILLIGNKSHPLNCLAMLLGDVSSNVLKTNQLILTPEKFEPDVGLVIQSMRSNIKNKKAVIILDLLNINVEALKAFHNLCDRINPLEREVIYIITIVAENYDGISNPLEFIEKELFKKLSGKIKKDTIQPLITRITDGPILIVRPEPTITDCPLLKS